MKLSKTFGPLSFSELQAQGLIEGMLAFTELFIENGDLLCLLKTLEKEGTTRSMPGFFLLQSPVLYVAEGYIELSLLMDAKTISYSPCKVRFFVCVEVLQCCLWCAAWAVGPYLNHFMNQYPLILTSMNVKRKCIPYSLTILWQIFNNISFFQNHHGARKHVCLKLGQWDQSPSQAESINVWLLIATTGTDVKSQNQNICWRWQTRWVYAAWERL